MTKAQPIKLPALPEMRYETKVILGLLGLSVWIAWRVRRGLSVIPFGIGDAAGSFLASSAQGYSDAATELANRPAGFGTGLEQAAGVLARATGAEAPPSIVSSPDRVAQESAGPFLGSPKNLLGIAGKVRFPVTGATLPTKLGADTFDVDAALENQSGVERKGLLSMIVREQDVLGRWNEATVDGGELVLGPREFRQVIVRAPNVVGRPFSPLSSSVRLRFANYTLDQVTFRRTYSLL